eukprot:107758-Alexandrium_andersonii.AAC.1
MRQGGVSDVRRFGATERTVWPVWRAETAAPSGWFWGPELTVTSHQSDQLGAPTYSSNRSEHLA